MENDLRERLLKTCIRYRAAINGVVPELMNCKEYREEKEQLEKMSVDELKAECDRLYYEVLYAK